MAKNFTVTNGKLTVIDTKSEELVLADLNGPELKRQERLLIQSLLDEQERLDVVQAKLAALRQVGLLVD